MQIVTRNAMMSAGTARRKAGSAVNRRRYAGLAMDCARPFMESVLTDALAASTRAMRGPRSDHPDPTLIGRMCRISPNHFALESRSHNLSRVINEILRTHIILARA